MYSRDNDATLPAVALRRPYQYHSDRLVATIVFHPEADRIGESAVIDIDACRSGAGFGRTMPLFSRCPRDAQDAGAPLDDPYVSRKALRVTLDKGQWQLARPAGSGPVKVAGSEVDDSGRYTAKQLSRGLVVTLSNRVVLLLKRLDFVVPTAPEPAAQAPLLGSSLYMRQLRSRVATLCSSEDDVLLTGETGSGKGAVAHALHTDDSTPFVAINMATLTSGLAAAILFGAERGAYTGSDRHRTGYFQRAHGGTLFLDEIGDTDADVQPQLLRALEEREVQVVGGPVVAVKLRVIAASDVDLEDSDSFRSALRYRLAGHTLHLAPLRERLEDVGELALNFIEQALPDFRPSLREASPLEQALWADLFATLLLYHWPGNIRQLRNACGEIVHDLQDKLPRAPDWLLQGLRAAPAACSAPGQRSVAEFSQAELLGEWERHAREVTATARSLGVSRQALYRRLSRIEGVRFVADIPATELAATVSLHGGDLAAAAEQLRVSRPALEQRWRSLKPPAGSGG